MNFTSIGLSTAVATVLVASVALAPAQAASFTGSQLDVTAKVRLSNLKNSNGYRLLDFEDFESSKTPGEGTGSVASTSGGFFKDFIGSNVKLQDLKLKVNPATRTYTLEIPVFSFIEGGSGASLFTYRLNTFTLSKVFDSSGKFRAYVGDMGGAFTYQGKEYGSVVNRFTLTDPVSFPTPEGSSGVISVGTPPASGVTPPATPVPTPALLPGLLAIAIGVLRQRKSNTLEKAEV